MTADLTEERSTANITTERLEAETAERLKLEKEVQMQHDKIRNLQDMSEKLEMELICAKSDMNGWVIFHFTPCQILIVFTVHVI